jgi:hypothetical protein
MARVMSRTTRPITQVRTLKEALARLAAVPPQSFTRERGRLVAQLHKAGDDKAAAHVKARRAPTLPVWLLNRLATEEPRGVDALIAATDRVKAAQLGRRPETGALAKAMADHRAATSHLLERGRSLLEELGARNARQMLSRVQRTLNASVVDASTRAALRRGRVEAEMAAPGFDVFGGVHLVATQKRPRDPEKPRQASKATSSPVAAPSAKLQERVDRLEAARQQRRARVEALGGAVAEAEEKATASKERASASKAHLAKLLEEVRQTKQALKERETEARELALALKRTQAELRVAGRRIGAVSRHNRKR